MSRQVDNESRVLVWVQTGPFVPYGAHLELRLVIPAGGEAPLLPICAHQIARNHGDYGGRNRESQAGSSRAVVDLSALVFIRKFSAAQF